jgi:hypothetical protein
VPGSRGSELRRHQERRPLAPAAVRRHQLVWRCAPRLAPLSTTHRGDRGARPLVLAPAGVPAGATISGARAREGPTVGVADATGRQPRGGAAAAVRPPLQLVRRWCGERRRLGENEWRRCWRACAAASGVRGGVRALRRRLGHKRPQRDGVVGLVDELDLLELVQRWAPRRGFEARSHDREEVLERLLCRNTGNGAGVDAGTTLQGLAVAGAPRVGDGFRLDGFRLAQPTPHARDRVLQRIIDEDHPARVPWAHLKQARQLGGGKRTTCATAKASLRAQATTSSLLLPVPHSTVG